MSQVLITLADAGLLEIIAPMLNVGAVGGVLLWFMFGLSPRMAKWEERMDKSDDDKRKAEEETRKELREVGKAIDRAARANLLLIVTLGTPSSKAQADSIIREIDKAEEDRSR